MALTRRVVVTKNLYFLSVFTGTFKRNILTQRAYKGNGILSLIILQKNHCIVAPQLTTSVIVQTDDVKNSDSRTFDGATTIF